MRILPWARLVGTLLGLWAIEANSQGAPIEFRLAAAKGNVADCQKYDASLSRVHTITRTSDGATIKSSGGITDNLKETEPQIYKSTTSLGGVKFLVVADESKVPNTLDVTYPTLGCRWNAVARTRSNERRSSP